MKEAVLKSLLFYVLGFSAVAVIYFQTDSYYAHGPSLYHLVLVLILVIGFVWLLITSLQYCLNPRKYLVGYIMVNGAVVLGFAIFIGYLIYQNQEYHAPLAIDDNELSVARMGDSTLMYHNDNLIYFQVKDSVYFDFRDNAAKKIQLR